MELRQYWRVIVKRRWLVLGILAVTILVSGGLFLRAPLSYQAESRFVTRQAPNAAGVSQQELFVQNPNGNWIGSEFLVDDYTQIVTSDAFAAGVLGVMSNTLTLGKEPGTLTRNDIKSAIEADRKQRELRVVVTAPSRDEASRFSQAVAIVLTELRFKPISGAMMDDKPVFSQIDQATPDEITSSRGKELINAAVRIVIGLALALLLAFLFEYLDNSVRDERDAQRILELPVLGTIPKS